MHRELKPIHVLTVVDAISSDLELSNMSGKDNFVGCGRCQGAIFTHLFVALGMVWARNEDTVNDEAEACLAVVRGGAMQSTLFVQASEGNDNTNVHHAMQHIRVSWHMITFIYALSSRILAYILLDIGYIYRWVT
jgi:hypothetical protein